MASLAAAEASVSPDDPIFHKPALPEVGHSWSCWEQGLQACLSGSGGEGNPDGVDLSIVSSLGQVSAVFYISPCII